MSEWELPYTHEEYFRMAMANDPPWPKGTPPLEAIRLIGAAIAEYRQQICDHQYQSDGRCAFCWKVKP